MKVICADPRSLPVSPVAGRCAQTDWPTFGHDLAGTRYSTLKQIDTKNVTTLVRAWTYHMNAGRRLRRQPRPLLASSEANDAATDGRGRGRAGRARWRRWSELGSIAAGDRRRHVHHHRSATAWPRSNRKPARNCGPTMSRTARPPRAGWSSGRATRQSPASVFFGTSSGKLIALNAKTGKPVPGFGNEGIVDMKPGASERSGQFVFRTVFSADRLQERRHHRRARAGRAQRRLGRRYPRLGCAHRQASLDVSFRAPARRNRKRYLERRRLEESFRHQRVGPVHARRGARASCTCPSASRPRTTGAATGPARICSARLWSRSTR